MSFNESMEKYVALVRKKAVLNQLRIHLSEFVSTDTRATPKSLKINEGSLNVEVDEPTLEQFICEMEERIVAVVKEMETL